MPRVALIDNATLTSVERLSGRIRVGNRYHVDADISAFEQFCQALLFFDQVCYVDDYKEKFRDRRRRFFHYISPLMISADDYNMFSEAAEEFVLDHVVEIENGEITEETVREFLRIVETSVAVQWNMRSSEWFLTYRLVLEGDDDNADKYGPVFTMLETQAYSGEGGKLKAPFAGITSDGIRFGDGEEVPYGRQIAGELTGIAQLNWLARRSFFYLLVGTSHACTVTPHPIRGSYTSAALSQVYTVECDQRAVVLGMLSGEIRDTISEVRALGDPITFSIDLPLFSVWAAASCRYPDEIIPTVLNMRDNPTIRNIRTNLDRLEELRFESSSMYFRHINSVRAELLKAKAQVAAEFNVITDQGPASAPSVGVGLGPISFGKEMKVPSVLSRAAAKVLDRVAPERRAFRMLARSVVSDLQQIPRLGALYEKLSANVRYIDRAGWRAPPTDVRRLVRRASHWKEPL